jgi:acyl-CoA synthetase (AMP-forming)/AMP-acid ligase II
MPFPTLPRILHTPLTPAPMVRVLARIPRPSAAHHHHHHHATRLRTLLTHASVAGPLTPPLDERTLPAFFATQLLPHHAARPALIARAERPRPFGGPRGAHDAHPHLRWSFAELDAHVAALGRGLLRMGVRKGDRVGVVMGNNR